MPDFNEEYLKGVSSGKIHHMFYEETVDHAEEMGVHVEGETPDKLLDINRPNEQKEIKNYRLETYQPVTQSLSEKVINTVNKIFNPRLWDIQYPDMSGVVGENTLAKYLTEDYPFYRSLMNFITETFTTKDFSDPNGAIVVMPQSFDIDETELFEPVATIYTSESLIDYVEDVYYTFKVGGVIKIFTEDNIFFYKKVKSSQKEKWTLYFEYNHDFGFPPVFRLGGIIKGKTEPFYYESWIRGILPHWNQVVQLTSDLQAAYISHLFMDAWEYSTECDGAGCQSGIVSRDVPMGDNMVTKEFECNRCSGTGVVVAKGPYGVRTVNRDALNPEVPGPIPPAGYIDKPIDVVDKVEDRISKEEKRGLASINMEIVQMVGTDQSGVAKTVDREDLNSFLSRYSRHVFEYVLPNLIFMISAWRYGDTHDIGDTMPAINQPKDFNILSLDQLTTEYKDASNANVSTGYLMHIEKEITNSKFANNDDARKKNNAIIDLNPYPGRSDDSLLTLRNLGEEDWVIYKYIHLIELVDMAIEEDNDFLDKSLNDQREIVNVMAKEAVGFNPDEEVIPTQPLIEEIAEPIIEDETEPEIEDEIIEDELIE